MVWVCSSALGLIPGTTLAEQDGTCLFTQHLGSRGRRIRSPILVLGYKVSLKTAWTVGDAVSKRKKNVSFLFVPQFKVLKLT